MLYTYKNIAHSFEKLHLFIEHTVLEVWCKPDAPFDIRMLHHEFRPLVEDVGKNKRDYLLNPIRRIYERFSLLDKKDLNRITEGFRANNNVKELCEGKHKPLLFSEIKEMDKELHDLLNQFGKQIYKNVPGLKSCKKHTGDINDYYNEFIKRNKAELCAFCGLSDLMSERLKPRDAFDHFLSKDKYPFISVHPANLPPMCYYCNSPYKAQQDPLTKGNRRRKVFYTHANSKRKIQIEVQLKTRDIQRLSMNDIELDLNCKGRREEVQSWVEIFGIDERYRDKLCKEKDGKYWYRQVQDECINYGKTPQEMYDIQVNARSTQPLAENNFLRVPFLKACHSKGLFN